MNYIFIILILIATLLEVSGDILFKYFVVNSKLPFLIAGITVYAVSIVFFIFSLKQDTLVKAISILSILNYILVLLAGFILFKEDVTILQKVGIVFGLLGIILIEI